MLSQSCVVVIGNKSAAYCFLRGGSVPCAGLTDGATTIYGATTS